MLLSSSTSLSFSIWVSVPSLRQPLLRIHSEVLVSFYHFYFPLVSFVLCITSESLVINIYNVKSYTIIFIFMENVITKRHIYKNIELILYVDILIFIRFIVLFSLVYFGLIIMNPPTS